METELQPHILADDPDLDLLCPDLTQRLQISRFQHVSKEGDTLLLGITCSEIDKWIMPFLRWLTS